MNFRKRSGVDVSGPGFVVWVQGTKGPELQRWAEKPMTNLHGTYWYEMNGRVLAIVEMTASDFAQPLHYLATKYPAPAPSPVRPKVLECDP